MKAVTLADVAAVAGVSGKTVSRVVNGEPHISASVHARVTKAVRDLGYRPNLAARSLASSRSFSIGVISRFDNGWFHGVHAQLASACRRHGFHLIVEQLPGWDDADEQIERLLGEVPLAGLIFTPGVTPSARIADRAASTGVRTVTFAGPAGIGDFGAVSAKEAQGEIELADHLWTLGHRHFAILRLPDELPMTRGMAFEQHLIALGMDLAHCRRFVFDHRLSALEAGQRAARDLLSINHLPTAVFAFGDEVAAGVIGVLYDAGVRVPHDVSVVGFDDGEVAKAIWPALTTVRQPIATMAEATIAMFGAGAEGRARTPTCPVELVVRSSTAPAGTFRQR